MVVVVIVFAIVVEPRLHAFGKILVVVDAAVLALPEASRHRCFVGRFQPGIESRVHVQHPAQMNVVGQLMDQMHSAAYGSPG